MTKKLLKFFLFVGIGLALPNLVFSQFNFNLPLAPTHELGIEIVPPYPGPNETVFVSLSLYSGDLSSAKITWLKDGIKALEGIGKISYSFKTGGSGESTRIEIKVELLGGGSFSQSFTINPAGVDLIWEANSYVPPFYKGKALHPRQGSLKIVAMPNFVREGKVVPASSLIYEWSHDAGVYQSQSGYGKNVLVLGGSIFGRAENISITVTDPKSNMLAQGFININPTNPEIVFYENSPFYGPIFDQAIGESYDLKSEEVQILAAPYYFSKNFESLAYGWRVNSQLIGELSGSRTAIFRKPSEESGRSSISLNIENLGRVLQFAGNGFSINFSN